MIDKKIDFLKARNTRKEDGEEIIFRHFIKSKKGYFLDAFFGVSSLKFFAGILFIGLLLLIDFFLLSKWKGLDKEFFIIMMAFAAFFVLCWIYSVAKKIWAWKYFKHVIVTNEGIWIMYYSTFWWSKAFDGKKHFLSPCWSLYSWSEIEQISEFSDRISRLNHLKCFKIKRWDGEEKVYYLKADDFKSFMIYAKENYRPKKRKKEVKGNLPKQIQFLKGLEKFFSGERDEE